MKIQDRTIELRGLRFRYREAGELQRPPVVLLHHLGGDSEGWDAVASALCDRFRVLALDQRGHGHSVRAVPYSFEEMRDDVGALVDRLGLPRFSLIGHSMGGTVAFLVAQRWPERVEALIVEDTPPPRGSNLPDPPQDPPGPVGFDWPLAHAIVQQLNRPDPAYWERLSAIEARTLIIGGGATSPIPQESLAEVAKRIPRAQLRTIDGAGHLVHATRPDEFTALVRSFLLGAELPLEIRRLPASELARIGEIDRREHITRLYRYRRGVLEERAVDEHVPRWSPHGRGPHSVQAKIDASKPALDRGGTLLGAFEGATLAGVAIYRPRLAESMGQLALLHVSRSARRRGVASRLTGEVARLARADGAHRLYVSATPSGSAVGFYLRQGFAPTDAPDPELFALEPEDIHMILEL